MTEFNAGVAATQMGLAASIVSAYVSKNHVPRDALPALINAVFAGLQTAATGSEKAAQSEPLTPAVPVKKSVGPDYIICLEDGKRFKSLKRHLMTHHNLTPDQYRAKWGLKADYPTVAANYSAARSALAVSLGLGRKTAAAPEPTPAEPEERVPTAPKRRAPRKPKKEDSDK